MGQYKKTDGNKYYLKKLNSESGELEWIEINLESSTEPVEELSKNEMIINKPTYEYYFEIDYPDYVTKSEYEDK
jgi:hypothetical protein